MNPVKQKVVAAGGSWPTGRRPGKTAENRPMGGKNGTCWKKITKL
jgi:hypothetical protein